MDLAHCGACGIGCATGGSCVAGSCQCPGAMGIACGGTCRDGATDAAHCGACGSSCSAACRGGRCVGVAQIAIGNDHTCARLTDGTVLCWGLNGNGQLGDGTTTYRETPDAVPGLTSVAEIATGGSHTCARRTDGTVLCWGGNSYGQIGDGTTTHRQTPTAVP